MVKKVRFSLPQLTFFYSKNIFLVILAPNHILARVSFFERFRQTVEFLFTGRLFLFSSLCIGLVIILSIVPLFYVVYILQWVLFLKWLVYLIFIFFIAYEYGLLHVHGNDKYNFQISCLSFYQLQIIFMFTHGKWRIFELKVHKNKNFLGSDFEICTFS